MGNTEHFQTKLSPTTGAKVRRAARRRKTTPSAWIRDLIERTLAGEPAAEPEAPTSFALPHIIGDDGACVGGCDPDLDLECRLGPDDPRRGKKRR